MLHCNRNPAAIDCAALKFRHVGMNVREFHGTAAHSARLRCSAKGMELWFAKRRLRRALPQLKKVRSVADAAAQFTSGDGESHAFVEAALTELKLSEAALESEGIKERVASRLERIEAAYGRRIM